MGRTLSDTANLAGIDGAGLEETLRQFNLGAERGEDSEFGRGTTAFNRYLGDPDHKPNPCVAPITQAPFYAVKLFMGDLGTFDGIKTDSSARVLNASGNPI